MDWIKVTPETMPPDMESIFVVLSFGRKRTLYHGRVRFNKNKNTFEVWFNDGYANGWSSGGINGFVTHWAQYPDLPAEDDE